jgi:hypothetical protein
MDLKAVKARRPRGKVPDPERLAAAVATFCPKRCSIATTPPRMSMRVSWLPKVEPASQCRRECGLGPLIRDVADRGRGPVQRKNGSLFVFDALRYLRHHETQGVIVMEIDRNKRIGTRIRMTRERHGLHIADVADRTAGLIST